MQLIGKLYRDTKAGWKADWTFVDARQGAVELVAAPTPTPRQLMATGADGAADALMKRYAKRGTAGQPGSYRVTFTGIDSSDDFIRLAGYLQKLAVVRRITPVRATPTGLEYDLELVSGLPGFNRMLARDDVVEVLEGLEGRAAGLPAALIGDANASAIAGRDRAVPAPPAVDCARPGRVLAGVAAGADPDAVRVRRDAGLARRSAGRPAASAPVARATSRWRWCSR